jgi:hypothetical protein
MSKYMIIDPVIGAPSPVSATATSQQWQLGYLAQGFDVATGKSSVNVGCGMFIYAIGSNIASLGQFVMLSNSSAVLLASANSASYFPVGVAAGNLSASNVFGWVQVAGICDYAVGGTNSSIGAGAPLYLAGTSGILITNVALGSHVAGVVAPVSFTSSQLSSFTVQLYNPFIPGLTASQ